MNRIIKQVPEFVSNVAAMIEHQTVTELLCRRINGNALQMKIQRMLLPLQTKGECSDVTWNEIRVDSCWFGWYSLTNRHTNTENSPEKRLMCY